MTYSAGSVSRGPITDRFSIPNGGTGGAGASAARDAHAAGRRNPFGRAFLRLEQWFDGSFGAASNPLRQLGALGFYFFWVVTASGIYVYIFFDTSIVGAYESLAALGRDQPYIGGVMRSVHRYASDAFVVVMVVHLVRELAYGRFRGFRWFSWLTGVPLLWLTFASGLVGYWLVWDQLAQFIGLTTTDWFGALPGFDVSMVRNFLVDDTLSDRFFSLLVFMHIGVPLMLLLGMWIHIQRMTGAKTLPERRLGCATLGMLVVLSLVKPALSQASVDLAVEPARLDFDWFYLFAYPWIYRSSAGAAWFVLAALTGLLCLAPWMVLRARAQPAVVDPSNCNGCGRCFADCPYGAVVMQPRAGSRTQQLAVVSGDLCAGCGICTGACPSSTPFRSIDILKTGIEMPQLSIAELRARMERRIGQLEGQTRILVVGCDRGPNVAPLCGPDVATIRLPCIGMLPPAFIEYGLRYGADGVMVAGCGEGDCEFRFGVEWTRLRIAGAREPALRASVPGERVKLVLPQDGFARELEEFRLRLKALDAPTIGIDLGRGRKREPIHG